MKKYIYWSKDQTIRCLVKTQGSNLILQLEQKKWYGWVHNNYDFIEIQLQPGMNEYPAWPLPQMSYVGGGHIEFWSPDNFDLEKRASEMFKDYEKKFNAANKMRDHVHSMFQSK